MRSLTLLLAPILVAAAVVAAPSVARSADAPASVDPSLILNYRQTRPGIGTAGRITPEGLAQLKTLGFHTIVNLRTEREGARDEEAAVRGLGLRYEWVPVTPETLTLEEVGRIQKILDEPAAAPILLHCASANRVGAVWAIIEVGRGKTLEAALEEGRTIGLSHPALVAVVERLAKEAAPSK